MSDYTLRTLTIGSRRVPERLGATASLSIATDRRLAPHDVETPLRQRGPEMLGVGPQPCHAVRLLF